MSWETAKLGDVTEVCRGTTITKKQTIAGNIPVIGGGKKPTYFHNEFNRDAGVITISGSGASAGFVNYWEEPIFASDCSTVQPFDESYDIKFLYFFLLSQQQFIYENFRSGAAQPHVYAKDIATLAIPKIHLSLQKQIVEKLDAAFADIDKAISATEKNIENAEALFQSCLNTIFKSAGNDWEEILFEEVCVLQRGFDLPKKDRNSGKNPLLSANGITDYIDRWKIEAPGVVTGRSGTIGKVHFIESDFWALNTALYVKDFRDNYEKFIYYFLSYFDLKSFSTGAGVPTLNRNNVHKVKVLFPKSKDQQIKLSNQLDEKKALISQLKPIYANRLDSLLALKSSILNKAFSDGLTQDAA